MTISKDLVAASATPLILSILRKGDSYGYDIIQKVHTLSDGEMQWSDGMLYPILHRLEGKDFIESYWQKAENGRRRKYYRIKKSGLEKLKELNQNWQNVYGWLQKSEEGAYV